MLIAISSGIVQGFGLAVVAFGFTLVYRANRTVNFAVGEGVVFGGYITWWLVDQKHLNIWVALVLALLAGAVFGQLVSLMLRGPIAEASMLTQVTVLVALNYVLTGLNTLWFGTTARNVPSPVSDTRIISGLDMTRLDLFIILAAVLLIGFALAVLYATRLGSDFRASASNRLGAQLIGVNPRLVGSVAWAAGMAASVLAGWLLLPKFLVSPTVGQQYLFAAFAAVVIGGFGSFLGSVVGGLVLGIANGLVAEYISAAYVPVVPLVVMLIVLGLRPSGLLGQRA